MFTQRKKQNHLKSRFPLPNKWNIGLDLMEFKSKNTLVSVDYFSGYITDDTLPSATSGAVICSLVNGFLKFGLPQTVLSYNGPCFKSEK